jgi:putative colanic acid biosynthesis acetyltransferase WcaF
MRASSYERKAGLRTVASALAIKENRKSVKYSRTEMLMRVVWSLAQPLFRFSPRVCFAWRRFLLRMFGAKIGHHVHIYNSATIYFPWNLEVGDWSSIGEHAYIYNLGMIRIGEKATVSQRAHLCAGTHDFRKPDLPLLKKPIIVGDQAWVCTDAFVGPGVTIAEGAIVGARAVAVKDVEAWSIVAGNPAQFIKRRVMV